MSYQNWRPVVGADDYFRQQEKRIMHEERRPQIRQASDLLGPGFGSRATAIADWNSDEAAFTGFFFTEPGAANAPDTNLRWIGITVGLPDESGLHFRPTRGLAAGAAVADQRRAVDAGAAALCAEAVGAMWSLHDMTLDYIKVRKQFGATIGSFQAIQHRMVNMYMKCQLAQSMALAGMAALDSSESARRRAVSAAKVQVGRAARQVGEDAIQLHGGIAMTDEYAAGHYFKRLTMIRLMFGDEEYHLRRYRSLAR